MEDAPKTPKIGRTAILVCVSVLEGCFSGILGPTLPDLQCLFHVDLKTISALFFIFGLMSAVGSLAAGFLLSKIDVNLLMAVAMAIGATALSVFPFLGNISAALVFAGVTATCHGLLFNSRLYSCNMLWPDAALPVHLVIAGYPVGSVIASLLAEPFLSERRIESTSVSSDIRCENVVTHIAYVYLILASFSIPIIVASFFYFLRYGNSSSVHSAILEFRSSIALYRRGYTLFVILFFLLCMPSGGIFVTFGQLISTYGTQSSLHLNVSFMALVTALFWGAFVVGRFLMTAVSGCARQIGIIVLSYVGLFTATILLVIFASKSVFFLLIAVAFFGVFCAPFSAATFSWTREYIPLTRFVISVGAVGEYTGIMTGPYIGGVLISHFGPDAFKFVILGIVVYQFVLFTCMYLVGNFVLDSMTDQTAILLKSESLRKSPDKLCDKIVKPVQPKTKDLK